MAAMLSASLLAVTTAAAAPAAQTSDKMIDVGGASLHFRVTPGCSPTIVLEAGGSLDSSEWSKIQPKLHAATGSAVVSYDRAGFGRSDLPDGTYGIDQQVTWLRQGLRKTHVPDDVVLVGHSYGALLVQLFAHRFPQMTKGVVLLDPQTVVTVDLIGGPSAVPFQMPTSPPKLVAAEKRKVDSFPADLNVVRQAPFPNTMPITVVAAGVRWLPTEELNKAFEAGRQSIVTGFPNRHLVVAEGSGHMISEDRPDMVLSTIQAMIDEARRSTGSGGSTCGPAVATAASR
jgi:pimeloyl-ACP methyl ester carboxylesterase